MFDHPGRDRHAVMTHRVLPSHGNPSACLPALRNSIIEIRPVLSGRQPFFNRGLLAGQSRHFPLVMPSTFRDNLLMAQQTAVRLVDRLFIRVTLSSFPRYLEAFMEWVHSTQHHLQVFGAGYPLPRLWKTSCIWLIPTPLSVHSASISSIGFRHLLLRLVKKGKELTEGLETGTKRQSSCVE